MSKLVPRAMAWLVAPLLAQAACVAVAAEEPPRKGPQMWAIVIGIDRYQDAAIPACTSAVRDARAIQQWLVRRAGWSARNVLVLQDTGAERPGSGREQAEDLKPTRANFDWAMTEWLAARIGPGDLVLFSYAGQAAALPAPAGAMPGASERAYLLPIDARAGDFLASGWSLESALDALAAPGRNAVVCWLDTSLVGRGQKPLVIPGLAPHPGGKRWLSKLARWPGVSVWLAADGHPAAEATGVGGQSALVGALLPALGTPRQPNNLLACLDRLNRDPALQKQGFRTLGGLSPELGLWPQSVRALAKPERALVLQRGHADRVEAITFTSDGARIVTASWDSTVKIWRTADRTLLRCLPEYFHYEGVSALALGPSALWLASGDGAGRVRFWNVVEEREKPLAGAPPHSSRILSLGFLPDGTHCVSIDQEGKAFLWDAGGASLSVKPLGDSVGALAWALVPGGAALAVAANSGPIRLLQADGRPYSAARAQAGQAGEAFAGPGKTITSLALSPNGRLVAAGEEEGRVDVWDLTSGKRILQQRFDGEVSLLAISATGALAVGTDQGLHLASIGGAGTQTLAEPPRQIVFSTDGRWLAACARRSGRVVLWQIDGQGTARSIALAGNEGPARAAVSLAFDPGASSLVAGDQDGGMRSWSLPEGARGPEIGPRRGKVAGLSASADGRYLLQITRDWTALLWDLRDGRGFLPIDGRWTSGLITPDGAWLALTSEKTGDVVIVDRATGRHLTSLPRPQARGGAGRTTWRFGAHNLTDGDQMLAISRDGRTLAACSAEGPLACVWDLNTAKLLHVVQDPDHTQPLAAIDLSPDGRFLLTADSGGTAKLWELGPGKPRALAAFTTPEIPMTGARLSPADPRTVATAGRDGRVLLWKAGDRQPEAVLLRMQAAARTVAFAPSGRFLVAGGIDKTLWHVPLARPNQAGRLDLPHPHSEQISALLPWPGDRMIASGSDDTTVRFWDLSARHLRGVLSAGQQPAENAEFGGLGLDTSWVAYTPEGLFDCAPGAERQVSWRVGNELLSFEQFAATNRVFGLTDSLRQGHEIPGRKGQAEAPPQLVIDPPTQTVIAGPDPRLELALWLADKNLSDLRLYQNAVPILSGDDLRFDPSGQRATAEITLRKGSNRFYAMASRAGSIDGRSNTIEVRYDGAGEPAQLHVLALGISRYKERPLRFAHADAQRIADFLHGHATRDTGRAGQSIVLTDNQVSNQRVEQALRDLQRRMKGRPQDTVVIFLAGHTDVLSGRYCLLLPDFPVGAAGRAQLGPSAAAEKTARGDDPATVLPYVLIYRNLARFAALQRLIVIDACQAEAALDDPGVRLIGRLVDDGAQSARTSYLLAARRGEPANEVPALQHGLLSYVLLKGMGAAGLEPLPRAIDLAAPNADLNGDRVVTTGELRRFVSLTLPPLAAHFPEFLGRGGDRNVSAAPRIGARLSVVPRTQTTGGNSFPLIDVSTPVK